MARVRVLPDDVELEVRDGEAILDAIRRAGYRCRYGCRRGGCGQCKADLERGELRYLATVAASVLSPEEVERGACLLCRTTPVGSEVAVIALRDEGLRAVSPFAVGRRHQASAGSDDTGREQARRGAGPAPSPAPRPEPPHAVGSDGAMVRAP